MSFASSGFPSLFQSTPLREGRRGLPHPLFPVDSFQSTPLREGRPGSRRDEALADPGFNPRPCARGDAG